MSEPSPSVTASHAPLHAPTERTGKIRLLIVSEVTTARPVYGTVRVYDQHVRKFGGYAPWFETTWTIVERREAGTARRTTTLPPNISVVWLPGFRSKWHFLLTLPRQLKALWNPIRDTQALLVSVPTLHAIPALLIARLLRTPSVGLVVARWGQLRKRGDEGKLHRVSSLLQMNFTALLASRLLIHGQSLIEEIHPVLRKKAVHVVLSLITNEDFAPVRTWDREVLELLCVGRLIPSKRFDVAIRAVGILRRRGYPVRLTIAGDGIVRGDLERLVHELDLQAVVRFEGWVDDVARLRSFYRSAFALLFPSQDEGIPLVVMEAMAAGLPIVSTPAGGLATFLQDGRNAIVIDSPDPEVFARAVQDLVPDRQQYLRLARGGQSTARKATKERWLQTLYENVLPSVAADTRRGRSSAQGAGCI